MWTLVPCQAHGGQGDTLPWFALMSFQPLIAELPSWISLNGAVTVVPAPAGAEELPGHFLCLA